MLMALALLLVLLLLLLALASALLLATVSVSASEQAERSRCQRETSEMTAQRAKFLFAGRACCSVLQIFSLLSTASESAICALRMAKGVASVSESEQEFARCDRH
jgi:hypothetical protein